MTIALIDRYRAVLPVSEATPVISLGEGSTNPPEAQCALFLLEHLLGEQDLMHGVGAIRIIPFSAKTDWPRRSLREVAAAFDAARAAP